MIQKHLNTVILTLMNERPLSWNKIYQGGHWGTRKDEADRVHELVKMSLKEMFGGDPVPKVWFTHRVDIIVTTFFKKDPVHRPLDSDNIGTKFYVDGLKKLLIKDDNMKYVRSTQSFVYPTEDRQRVVIEVREVDNEPEI